MSVEIRILDERSIGRCFQAAAIGCVIENLPKTLQGKLLEGFVKGKVVLELEEAKEVIDNIVSYLESITRVKKATFRLYRAGNKRDEQILSEIVDNPEKSFTKKDTPLDRWLIEIAPIVVHNANKPIDDIPMFLRHYVFSKYRDLREIKEDEKTKINAISLYIATAGALVSIVTTLRRGNSTYEFYLVPDTSLESIRYSYRIYAIQHAIGDDIGHLGNYVERLRKIENLSLELTLLLSIALHIHNVTSKISGIPPLTDLFNVFEKFRIIGVVPQDRPLIVWERPLALTHIFELLDRRRALYILEDLYACADYALEFLEEVPRSVDVVSQCITSLFAYIETGSLDALFLCGAGAQRISDQFSYLCRKKSKKEEKDLKDCRAEKTFRDLTRSIARLI